MTPTVIDVLTADETVRTNADVELGVSLTPLSATLETRISDFDVVPYRRKQSPRLDFWGSDVRNDTREGDTLWVNYKTSHFSRDFRFACPGWSLYTPESRRAHEILFVAQSAGSRGCHRSPR